MKVFKNIVAISTLLIYTTNINGQTLNCPQFTATGTSQSGYIGPSSGCQAICPQALNSSTYPWDGGSSAGSLVATSLTPTTSLALAFFAVNTDDYATVTVNGGGTVSLTVSGCGVAGNVIGPYNCSGYGDVFVTVHSTLPFTVVTISNTGGSSGWVISCPGSAPNAGLDYNNFSSPLCGGTLNLNTVLSGADAGGVWVETTSSGQFTPGTGVFNVNGLAPGIYTFTYTVTSCGFTDVANISIKVGSGPKAGNDNTSSLCNTTGSTINLNTLLSGADPGGTWAETTSSGQFTPGTGIFNANGLAGGNYTFTYTVPGSTPCPNDVANFTVTVNPAPVYSVSGTNPSTCSGADGFLTISGLTPNTSYSVSYTKNGTTVGPTSLTSNASGIITISGLGSGTYTNYSISSTAGCTKTNSTIVTLVQPVTPTVNAGIDQTVCIGANVTLTASNPNSASISWSNGITDGTPFSASTTTTYTVTATLSGCTSTDQVVVNVNPLPTINAGIDQALCNGTSTSLSGSGGTSYTWNNGITNGATFTPAIGTTTYTVTGTDANGCTNTDAINITVNAIPVVNAGIDQTVCSGTSVTLNGSGAGTGGIYTWDNGITDNVSFTQATGTITYTVTGTDANGCSSTDQANITVNPIPVVNAGLDKAICLGDNVTLTASNPNGATISWNNGITDGVPFSTSTTMTFTVTANLLSCISTDQVVVTVNTHPTINAGIDQTLCAGTPVTLNASGAGTGGTYTWNNGVPNNVPFTQTTGTTNYIVTGTDVNGCTNTDAVSVTVNAIPVVNAGADQSVCIGSQVTLTATGSTTYTWDNSVTNGTAFTPALGTITYNVSGTTSGCTSTDQVVVTVNPLPTVKATADTVLCEQQSIILVGSGASNYSWNNGITNGIAFIPTGTTTYTVTGTDVNGCKNIDSVLITIIPTPTVDFFSNNVLSCSPLAFTLSNNSVGNLTNCKWTLSNGQTFNGCGPVSDTLLTVGCYDVTLLVTTPEGCSNTLTKSDYICVAPDPIAKFYTDPNELSTLVWKANMNNTSIGATTYEWNFGDNTGNSTETSPSHEFPNEEGKTYTITLIAKSDIGCVDTTKGNITLVEDLIYYVPNTFTPDANKFNETFLPVFTSGFDPQNYTLLIFDRWGEILFESHNAKIGWDGTFNGKVAPDGTYIWKISFKLKNNDERQDHFGNINLLR